MGRPCISVVMPLYNKAAYVVAAVASALSQGAALGELIVIDDGSTDEGPAQVVQLACMDARIRLITQANAGVAEARNRGINAARGELIAFLDADDAYLPGYLDALLQLAGQHETAVMFCTGYFVLHPDGRREPRLLKKTAKSPAEPVWQGEVDDFYRAWGRGAFTCTNAIAVRKSHLLRQNLFFPTAEPLGEDQDLWFRLAESGPVAYRNEPLAIYRLGVANSATQTTMPTDILPCYQRLHARLQQKMVPDHLVGSARALFASHLLNLARARLQRGEGAAARALLLDPRVRAQPVYWARMLCLYAGRCIAGMFASMRPQ